MRFFLIDKPGPGSVHSVHPKSVEIALLKFLTTSKIKKMIIDERRRENEETLVCIYKCVYEYFERKGSTTLAI